MEIRRRGRHRRRPNLALPASLACAFGLMGLALVAQTPVQPDVPAPSVQVVTPAPTPLPWPVPAGSPFTWTVAPSTAAVMEVAQVVAHHPAPVARPVVATVVALLTETVHPAPSRPVAVAPAAVPVDEPRHDPPAQADGDQDTPATVAPPAAPPQPPQTPPTQTSSGDEQWVSSVRHETSWDGHPHVHRHVTRGGHDD